MTQEEILEYNKRCAEFLGSELKNDGQYDYWTYEHLGFNPMKISGSAWISGNFEFHSDWNWIMEVVEAIENRGIVVLIGKNTCVIEQTYGKTTIELPSIKKNSKKEAVVEAINQFLIWHSENN